MSPKTRRQEVDRELLMLTEEQFSALDQTVLNPRVVFSGPGGDRQDGSRDGSLEEALCRAKEQSGGPLLLQQAARE